MSEHASPNASPAELVTLESGLEALQSGVEFQGPVEELGDHHCNDHFAQIYESDEERFAAAVPFVRHGLEHDERVMYVVDESSEEEVKAGLHDAGIGVEAALDSGTLSFHTVEDTYLRNGSFEPDEMVDFYADTVTTATAEYEALRIVAETTWLQDETTTVEQFMEYESKVNDLFADEDCLALCQYDRDGFPPEVVRNVVQTHPHLIYDGAVCHNFYYTPPSEFFGADDPAREVNRMLGTLRERTEAKTDLTEHKRFLRELNEVTASQHLSFEEKLRALFELGREWFDLELGALNRVDPDDDWLEVEYVSGDHDHFEPGVELPLSQTYCQAATDIKEVASVSAPTEEGFDDILVYEELGVEGYLGTYVPVDGGPDRTLAFVPDGSEMGSVSEEDRTYLELMGQWVGYELNRRQRERFLRECYEITSDPARSFDEKLEQLLEFGREWFGLDMAGLNHLPSWDGKFRLEKGIGLGVGPDDELWTDPGYGCFCRQTITEEEPVGMADVRETCWEDDQIYEEFGLTSYLGIKVTSGSSLYGTLWFGSTEPRDRPFSDAERTFIELIGQWVSYELDRNHRETQLERKNDRLENFASMLAHELRNPVTIGQIYGQQLPEETDSEAVDYVTEAFDRIENMVDVMLVLTRGQEAVDRCTSVELADVAREAWDEVDAPDATLDATTDRTIQADETYIRHLFRNLFENAVEHGSADATVTVGELPDDPASEDSSGDEASSGDGFYVADDGDGIPADERHAVFDEGYTTAAESGGMGLGLAFVQKLAEVYEWDCTVTESETGGARFEFRVD